MEIMELKKEIEEIKNCLSELIEISLKEIKKKDYLYWNSVKNEI